MGISNKPWTFTTEECNLHRLNNNTSSSPRLSTWANTTATHSLSLSRFKTPKTSKSPSKLNSLNSKPSIYIPLYNSNRYSKSKTGLGTIKSISITIIHPALNKSNPSCKDSSLLRLPTSRPNKFSTTKNPNLTNCSKNMTISLPSWKACLFTSFPKDGSISGNSSFLSTQKYQAKIQDLSQSSKSLTTFIMGFLTIENKNIIPIFIFSNLASIKFCPNNVGNSSMKGMEAFRLLDLTYLMRVNRLRL